VEGEEDDLPKPLWREKRMIYQIISGGRRG